jgi:hypothetical protein
MGPTRHSSPSHLRPPSPWPAPPSFPPAARRWQGHPTAGQGGAAASAAGRSRRARRRDAGEPHGQSAVGSCLAVAAALETSAETRGTRKNEESTGISASPRFDLNQWTKKMVVEGVKSTMGGSRGPWMAGGPGILDSWPCGGRSSDLRGWEGS